MGASATLTTTAVAVEPGHEVGCPVVVTNTGSVVDQFQVAIVGDAAGWGTAEPAVVGLLPGESATVTLRFAPPRAADLAAGPVPFAVHVTSQQDPSGSVVEEGTVEVGAFADLTVELAPATAQGSRRAAFEVVVDNAGNRPVEVTLGAVDREDALEFGFERTRFTLDAGTVAFVRLRARARERFMRGQPRRHPFQVRASVDGGEPLTADGTMIQRQLLPAWLVPLLVALLLLGVALAVLWFTVLRPAVRSAARAEAEQQVVQVRLEAEQAKQEAEQAKQEAAGAQEDVQAVADATGVDLENPQDPPTSTAPPEPTSELTDFRIAANARPVTNARAFTEFPFTPGDGTRTLMVTDLVLQNSRGHRGILQVLRERDGENTLLWETGLESHRDYDLRWATPWRFQPGDRVIVAVNCQNTDAAVPCTPAVSFSGRLEG